jgi:hypothetical protein
MLLTEVGIVIDVRVKQRMEIDAILPAENFSRIASFVMNSNLRNE